MGTSIRFKRPERAAFMAALLKKRGHGVIWSPRVPRVIMTSAEQHEVARLAKAKGTIDDWDSLAVIDCDKYHADKPKAG